MERRQNHPLRAKNGHMSIILTHEVPFLGRPGDLVKVRPGFARNYLIPQGFATFATPHNLRVVEKHRERLRELEEARRADLLNLAAQIAQRSLTIEANANEEGHLFGSVNDVQIAETLKSEGFPITAENVRIEGPLKDLGLYTIKLHLGQDIYTEVKLWVVPTHTEEAAS
ncbi:50S ribosomal protein L9 [Planctomyces sp. SH-PL62]|uniref:50S ribosomal protein L9 n=1 Tax=Planctomyces sp. SH-PL62 TaxID=1636152 RepID=UPI001E34C1D6|nr:50S ribosomal protein L9 [Planctomyces sp. SH-PL62]